MGFEIADGGVTWRGDGETVRLDGWGRGVRVRAALAGPVTDPPFALLDEQRVAAEVALDGRAVTLTVGNTVVVAQEEDYNDWSTGFWTTRLSVRLTDRDGRVLLQDIPDGGALKLKAREYRPAPTGGASIRFRRSRRAKST